MFKVVWEHSARKDLEDIPHNISKRIVQKVESYLSKEPKLLGETLVGSFSGYYRYRINDYRVIYSIIEEEVLIRVVQVGHRKNVYDE